MKIGFMQGRLSDLVNNRIQAFPWENWRNEFAIAEKINVSMMEWTLDQEGLRENPFNTMAGQNEIKQLMTKTGLEIPSLTGDCFMQAPFYKAKTPSEKKSLLQDLDLVIQSCSNLGTQFIVFPLVDNGSIENDEQKNVLIDELLLRAPVLRQKNVIIVFESDYPPKQLAEFIEQLPSDVFGINYDSGNSASLGFNVNEEFASYANRILNIHIKDRIRGGTTVPLGEGDTDFKNLFACLRKYNYQGNLILQTARAKDNNHAQAIQHYVNFVERGLQNAN